jgi:hypothetical protein
MVVMHPTKRPVNSNAFARERDAVLLRLLAHHPTTVEMLVSLRLFPTARRARRRLHRLCQRRKIRCLGSVSLKGGRPEHVYGRGMVKNDNLLHEVLLTRVCLRIQAAEVRRGHGEVDRLLLPDAELVINGDRYCLEMDCGTMSVRDIVRNRFVKYRTCPDFVFWICQDERRMETLRRRAGTIWKTALFTTLDQALADPHAAIWIDADGECAALPRNRKQEGHMGEP